MKNIEIAKRKFEEGFNCAQSVLYAFSDSDLIDADTALKIGAGFGGGIARNGQVCGAFAAAVMLIGLSDGNGIGQNPKVKNEIYQTIDKYIESFKERHQSINCREILKGCELKTETGRQMFEENKFDENICIKCIETAVELLNNSIQNK